MADENDNEPNVGLTETEEDKELKEEEEDDRTAEEGGQRPEQDQDVKSDPDEQGVPAPSTR